MDWTFWLSRITWINPSYTVYQWLLPNPLLMTGILEGVAEPKVLIFPEFLHPGRLTWNLQITHLQRKITFQTSMILFHVNLPGCNLCIHAMSVVLKKSNSSSKSSPKKVMGKEAGEVFPRNFRLTWGEFCDFAKFGGYLFIKIEYIQLGGGFKRFF